jgi:DHA2 family multidrug resistance protein
MGYTSQDTGLLLLPSALASAVGMVVVSIVGRKIDARLQIATGATIIIFTMYRLNRLTPESGKADFLLPLIFRSFGTVMMFLPLSLASLGAVPKRDVAAASGLYNLTRQLGGSVGIAILTTMIDTRTIFHRTQIVANLAANDPNVLARVQLYTRAFIAHGVDMLTAQKGGLALLDRVVSVQAQVMSFNDTFTMTAWAFAASLPLIMLLGKGDAKPGAQMGH